MFTKRSAAELNVRSIRYKIFVFSLSYVTKIENKDVPQQYLDDKSNWVWYLNKNGDANYNNAARFYGPKLTLSNGAIIWLGRHRSVPNNYLEHGLMSDIQVDINGQKGPNTYGRDVFCLTVFDDDRIVPIGSKLYSRDSGSGDETTSHWTGSTVNANCKSPAEAPVGSSEGNGCAARIIEEGWKMTY